MKNNIIKKILALVFLLISAVSFTACMGEPTLDELLKENNAVAMVTYYANGGMFNGKDNLVKKNFFYKENDYICNVGVYETQPVITITKTDYVFVGWNYAERDEQGKVIYTDNEKKYAVASDVPFEFPYRAQKGDEIHLVAIWEEDVGVDFYLSSDKPITGTDGKVYKNGDKLSRETFGRWNDKDFTDTIPVASTDSTCYGIYLDEACTIPLTERVSKPTNKENIKLYAKYIEGVWTFVKTPSDVKAMFDGMATAGKRYYLFNDIDCTGFNFATAWNLECEINGNGFTISNINVSESGIKNEFNYSLFGDLTATAFVHDLTFKNISVEYAVRSGMGNLYALFNSVSSQATLSNFTIDGITMTVKSYNLNNVLNLNTDTKWLCGGLTNDEVTQISGFTLLNYNLVKTEGV